VGGLRGGWMDGCVGGGAIGPVEALDGDRGPGDTGPTCQFRRAPDDAGPPPGRGVGGPPSDDGALPMAAGLSRGISDSGGGPIGSCVHGPSASATSSGVW
jgi:hypothetical protein